MTLRILLVDDSRFILKAVSAMLNEIGGIEIETASDGQKAVDILRDREFDIIISDLNMPNMDGLELLRNLAELNVKAALVLMSAEDKRILNTTQQLARAHDLYVLGFLEKPFKVPALKRLIDTYETQRRTAEARVQEQLNADELADGLRSSALFPVYQPKIALDSSRVIGMESLARWRKNGSVLGPGAFIDSAEEHGFAEELTMSMLEQSLNDLSLWLQEGIKLKMSVNLSVSLLGNLELPDKIKNLARSAGVDPNFLILEVTESQIIQDLRKPLEVLTRLRLNNFEISVDDFGTGASTFQQLQRVPCNELKIDRAFVTNATNDNDARAMLKAGVDIGRRMDLEIVAEGIETQEDWDLVREVGCHVGQGYMMAKPMPSDDFSDWLLNSPYDVTT